MSAKTESQTSDLPDAHGDEDNTDIEKVYIKEGLCVSRQMRATDEETSDSISSDEDNTDIEKVYIKEGLCVSRQMRATDEETSDSISSGRTDVTPTDGSADEYGGEPYVCDQVMSQTAVILVMVSVLMLILVFFKIEEDTWEIYVLNVGNVLLGNHILLVIRKLIQEKEDFHVLNVGNILLQNPLLLDIRKIIQGKKHFHVLTVRDVLL
ncbi:uncharacterized protein LOC128655599 [Bombina bombina]|uniref:uncharacterized protein LOC128655599 n=1 Tax=Bombina bombina TaxID=8345 RepID=UPI00235AE1A5|nr:uncharacterized protein LOC128655599 [Bombina bombina]